MQGDGSPIIPFEAPSTTDRAFAKKNNLKASLRFGYLSDDRKAESLRGRVEYNIEGYPERSYDFSSAGGVAAKKEYTYDATGTKILSATIERYQQDGDLETLLAYNFDAEGRLESYREMNAQGHERRMVYSYNAQKKLVRLQYLEPDGLPGGNEVYTYDVGGSSASLEKRDIAGDLMERVTWLFDAKGRILKENRYIGSGTPVLLYSYSFQYDAKGHPIRKEKLSRDLEITGWESWSYDANGRVTEHKTLESGEAKPMRETFTYNSKGRMTQNITYNPDGAIFQWFKYSYDSLGVGAGMQRLLPDGKVDLKKMAVFNKDRQVIRLEETYPDGSGDLKLEFRYDVDGLLLEEKHWEMGIEQAVFWFVHERF